MLDFAGLDSLQTEVETTRSPLNVIRQRRSARVAAMAGTGHAPVVAENIFAPTGTQMATTLDLRPENLFA
ncbi:MAG: hypothetical protein AAF914_01505 [Pseudomonadota bacterium]